MLLAADLKVLRRVAEVAEVAAITGSCRGGLREPRQSRPMAASPRSSKGKEKNWSRCRREVEAMLSEEDCVADLGSRGRRRRIRCLCRRLGRRSGDKRSRRQWKPRVTRDRR